MPLDSVKPPETASHGESFKAVFLFGPTAVGKTKTIETLSASIPGLEIISADSVQVYRGLNIGSAKPTPEELAMVRHHNIDVRNPDEPYSVADFVKIAENAMHDIQSRGGVPVISGGTAFYLKHLWFGLPESPPANREVAESLKQRCEQEGIEVLRAELEKADPVSFARIAPADEYRILRALEVYISNGRPLSSYVLPDSPRLDMQVLPLALRREREELYGRIDRRVELMFDNGLETEVLELMNAGYTAEDPGMKAIGYREFFDAAAFAELQSQHRLDSSRQAVVSAIQQASRRYAKRQMTFFRSLPDVQWLDADKIDGVEERVRSFFPVNTA